MVNRLQGTKILVIPIVSIFLICSAVQQANAISNDTKIVITPFEISLSPQDFDSQGPLHQIKIVKPNETVTIPIKITNHDSVEHEITFDFAFPDFTTMSELYFEPQTIIVKPTSENQTFLHLTVKNNTETHWTTIPFFAKSNSFGMVGKYFYLVVGDKSEITELDPFIDHSMREGMPGPAFPQVIKDFPVDSSKLLKDLDKIMPEGFVAPRYLPKGYSFQGTNLPAPLVGFLYAPTKIENTTEGIDFWRSGILIHSEPNSFNFNLTSWLPAYVAQNEAKQIMINGLIGVATEQQERTVVEGPKYMFPAEIVLFDKNTEVELRGNIPLDELVKVAASMRPIENPDIFGGGEKARTLNLSPMAQFKSGIAAEDVVCKEGLQLIIKRVNYFPACVKPETYQELIRRDWGIWKGEMIKKIWVEIDPIQCGGNPWEQDWVRSHPDDNLVYARAISKDKIDIVTNYYKKIGITIFDVKLIPWENTGVCGSCSCPAGYTQSLLVPNSDVDKMLGFGYKISENIR